MKARCTKCRSVVSTSATGPTGCPVCGAPSSVQPLAPVKADLAQYGEAAQSPGTAHEWACLLVFAALLGGWCLIVYRAHADRPAIAWPLMFLGYFAVGSLMGGVYAPGSGWRLGAPASADADAIPVGFEDRPVLPLADGEQLARWDLEGSLRATDQGLRLEGSWRPGGAARLLRTGCLGALMFGPIIRRPRVQAIAAEDVECVIVKEQGRSHQYYLIQRYGPRLRTVHVFFPLSRDDERTRALLEAHVPPERFAVASR